MGQTHQDAAANRSATQQFLTFSLSGEMFGVGILTVKEIIEYGEVTEIPMVPAFICGVINLRGAVVPVIDLAARFGNTPTIPSRRTCIIILEIRHEDSTQTLGVLVDSVSAVLDIPTSEIEPPPAFGARIRADFIVGMGKVDGHFVILLDIERVLSVDEIATLASLGESDTSEAVSASLN